jgi:DNA-binding winged helix-turn-helix (wHTH) protein/Tol biopolymer transport system component
MPAEPSTERDRVFRFGPFELSEREAELRKSGVRIKLQEQPFRVLVELVANSGNLVSREDLHKKLWPADTFVDFDVGLNSAIRKLRQALNDDADNPRYIETLAKRGYRFAAPVAQVGSALPEAGEAAAATTSTKPPETASGSGRRVWPWVAAASLATLVIVVAFMGWRGRHSAPPLAIEQRITSNPPEAPITGAVISPDGNYLAYSDPTGVYVRHIASGETRPLQLPAHFDAIPSGWFPDNTHLLLAADEGANEVPCMWKASILGGNPQILIANAIAGVVSPDGSAIGFLRIGADNLELWVSRSDGTNAKRLVEAVAPAISVREGRGPGNPLYTGSAITHLAWSPHGKRIAYITSPWPIFPDPSMDSRFTLETVDTAGGPSKLLKDSVQLRPMLAWAGDGRLIFAQREGQSNSTDTAIWSLRVNEITGEAGGNAVLVSKGAGRIGDLSVSRDGKKIAVMRANTQPEVFISELDPSSRRLLAPKRFALDENLNVASAWTLDSRAVIMASNRSGEWKLFRQALDQVTPEAVASGIRNLLLPRLSPDGTRILYFTGANPDDPQHMGDVMAIPLEGGPPRSILRTPALYNLQCARKPSQLCMLTIYAGSAYQPAYQLLSFDPESGKTQNIATYKATTFLNWSLSPNGSQLALTWTNSEPKVTFMSINDKSTRHVELNGFSHVNTVDWTADNKSVYVVAQSKSGADTIVEVEPSGNQRVLLEADKNTRFWWAIQSPDGRHVLIEQLTGENNVWLIENF